MCEADFYQESMHKRIKKVTDKPLHMRLRTRYEQPPASVLNQLTIQQVLGNYSLEVVKNNWHVGQIIEENGKYFWKNKAGASWEVIPDLKNGKLRSTSKTDHSKGHDIQIILKRDENTGEFFQLSMASVTITPY